MGRQGCKHLRFIGSCLPSWVHLANVRFHFNGWHTERRYQRRSRSTCTFCQGDGSEDSIEHLLHCSVVQAFLPQSFKKGYPPHTPVKYFCLFGIDNTHRIAMTLFICALYSMHHELRHNPCHMELRQCIFRIAAEVRLSAPLRNVWDEVFGWSLNH